MEKISVIITTHNEEVNISDCIATVPFADEILVIDSFSQDNTVAIAQSLGATVIQRQYKYAADQKNFAIPLVKNTWILLLDADERIDKSLTEEIKNLDLATTNVDGYIIKRENYFLGKKIKFSGWQNDKVLRLFRKSMRYEDKTVHSEMLTEDKQIAELKHPMQHFTFKNKKHFEEKVERYAKYRAQAYFKDKKQSNKLIQYTKTIIRFFRNYVIKGGFLDGSQGLYICKQAAREVYLRYQFLQQMKGKNG